MTYSPGLTLLGKSPPYRHLTIPNSLQLVYELPLYILFLIPSILHSVLAIGTPTTRRYGTKKILSSSHHLPGYNTIIRKIVFFFIQIITAPENTLKHTPELLFTFNSQLSSWIIFCTPFLAHPRHDCTSIFLLGTPKPTRVVGWMGAGTFFCLFVCNHWLCCLLGWGVGRLHMETKLMTGLAPAGWMATIERIPKKDRNAVVSSWKSTMGLGQCASACASGAILYSIVL